MDINICKEKGCIRSAEAMHPDGSKYKTAVCGWSGEPLDKKVCHIYDETNDMRVKFNRITVLKTKTFLETDLPRMRKTIADGLGVNVDEIYFNYSRIGD